MGLTVTTCKDVRLVGRMLRKGTEVEVERVYRYGDAPTLGDRAIVRIAGRDRHDQRVSVHVGDIEKAERDEVAKRVEIISVFDTPWRW